MQIPGVSLLMDDTWRSRRLLATSYFHFVVFCVSSHSQRHHHHEARIVGPHTLQFLNGKESSLQVKRSSFIEVRIGTARS